MNKFCDLVISGQHVPIPWSQQHKKKCAVCWEEKPAFWSCVCKSGHVCKSCYTFPLNNTRKCPVCMRSNADIVLKEKYDNRMKWCLIIATGIYVFLFAFVCYMIYTRIAC